MKFLPLIVIALFSIIIESSNAKDIEFISGNNPRIKWKTKPQILFNSSILQGESRDISIIIITNESGEIIGSEIDKSSGIAELDALVMNQIKKFSLYPYEENGKFYPLRVAQPFTFYADNNQIDTLIRAESDISKLIEKRIHKEIMDLWEVPAGSANLTNLISFNVSKNNSIESLRIIQSSGDRKFDLSTLQAVLYSPLIKNLSINEKAAFFGKLESKKITILFKSK